ncbi:hypothetical protein D1007_44351 [Hordeum vulgare]|nr:hypothetical protein D1007_44351 [Hordeum vulgare]
MGALLPLRRLPLPRHLPTAVRVLLRQVQRPPVLEVGGLLLRCRAQPDGRRADPLADASGPLVDLRLRLTLQRRGHDAIAGDRQRDGLLELRLVCRVLLIGIALLFLLALAKWAASAAL